MKLGLIGAHLREKGNKEVNLTANSWHKAEIIAYQDEDMSTSIPIKRPSGRKDRKRFSS